MVPINPEYMSVAGPIAFMLTVATLVLSIHISFRLLIERVNPGKTRLMLFVILFATSYLAWLIHLWVVADLFVLTSIGLGIVGALIILSQMILYYSSKSNKGV